MGRTTAVETSDPWQHGSHRVSIMRKIGDEETVLIESYAKTHGDALGRLSAYLAAIRQHKAEYNRLVVMAARKQLSLIEAKIEERGQLLRDIEAKLAVYEGTAPPQPNGPEPSILRDEDE